MSQADKKKKYPGLYSRVKNKYYATLSYDYDLPQILNFFAKYSQEEKSKCKVLDIGCGYGKKLKALQKSGYDALGVDVNPKLIEANKAKGMKCATLEEFAQDSEQFDIILMSHIIEHFNPLDLKDFMDSYLERLKIGGYLIIATPLLSSFFYDDFDHIKPYSPTGIMMVFGENQGDQVQYYSKNKLKLKDLWFRKRHYRPQFFKGKYLEDKTSSFLNLVEFCSILLCRGSFGIIGRTDGWIGVFEKIKAVEE